MWLLRASLIFTSVAAVIAASALPRTHLDVASLFNSKVAKNLSGNAFIQAGHDAPTRWSLFDQPQPAIVVNVATEKDVALVVRFCNLFNIPFLAQNGGVGWATFDPNSTWGVLINMAGLNQFTPSANKTQTTVGGGLKINDTLPAAWAQGVQVESGNCNCAGLLGVYLGGGYGNLMGLYGFGVDNILSMRLVTPQGDLKTVTQQSDPDLFWAMRGAGPNFGIVTSAVIKSYPVPQSKSFAWTGGLVFDPSHLEEVVSAIGEIHLKEDMNVFMYFISTGGPPVILTTPFQYQGNQTSFKEAFASLYAIPYISDTTAHVDYKDFNSAADVFCERGARKPSYGAGFIKMVPETWRNIWNEYVKFQALPGAASSVVLVEIYSLIKARSIPADQQGAFPHRDLSFNAAVLPWYANASLDAQAQAFGNYVRDQWRSTGGLLPSGRNSTYVNFAHGDEDNDVIYGSSLARLKHIKKRVDPQNVMRQWFNIKA